MASALTDRLSRLVKTMRGQARITEDNVQDMKGRGTEGLARRSGDTEQAKEGDCRA